MRREKEKTAQSEYLLCFSDRTKKIVISPEEYSAARREEREARAEIAECDFSRDTSSWD